MRKFECHSIHFNLPIFTGKGFTLIAVSLYFDDNINVGIMI